MSSLTSLVKAVSIIKNAQSARHEYCVVRPYTKLVHDALVIMTEEGYIEEFKPFSIENGGYVAQIKLKYYYNRLKRTTTPVIQDLKLLSTSSKLSYFDSDNPPRLESNLGVVIVTTSKGVMKLQDAVEQRVGGKLLVSIF